MFNTWPGMRSRERQGFTTGAQESHAEHRRANFDLSQPSASMGGRSMAKSSRGPQRPKSAKAKSKATVPAVRQGGAPPHQPLVNDVVHIFVDDQNLFWGVVNDEAGHSFRVDFGELALETAKDAKRRQRGVKTAFIAGVIPDDDSFWQIAINHGWEVRRGFLGSNNRSKQDDAYLITDITATLFEQQGPSTIVLVAGDADYVPPLKKALEKGWRVEVVFMAKGLSTALHPVVHEFRTLNPSTIRYEP